MKQESRKECEDENHGTDNVTISKSGTGGKIDEESESKAWKISIDSVISCCIYSSCSLSGAISGITKTRFARGLPTFGANWSERKRARSSDAAIEAFTSRDEQTCECTCSEDRDRGCLRAGFEDPVAPFVELFKAARALGSIDFRRCSSYQLGISVRQTLDVDKRDSKRTF